MTPPDPTGVDRPTWRQGVTRLGGVSPASTALTPAQARRPISVRVARVALPMCGNSTAFGAVTTQKNVPRRLQAMLRIQF